MLSHGTGSTCKRDGSTYKRESSTCKRDGSTCKQDGHIGYCRDKNKQVHRQRSGVLQQQLLRGWRYGTSYVPATLITCAYGSHAYVCYACACSHTGCEERGGSLIQGLQLESLMGIVPREIHVNAGRSHTQLQRHKKKDKYIGKQIEDEAINNISTKTKKQGMEGAQA